MPLFYGKEELKNLGCNFVVVNVPVFVTLPDSQKVNKMVTTKFQSEEELKVYFSKYTPMFVFDMTGVYKDTNKNQSSNDGIIVRCCHVEPKEFEILKNNLKETENLNYTFNFDFSCWFPKK